MTIATLSEVLAALRAGDRILVTNPDPFKVTDRPSYALVDLGAGIPATVFKTLRRDLEPAGDGLFGASQTYRLAPGSQAGKPRRGRANRAA